MIVFNMWSTVLCVASVVSAAAAQGSVTESRLVQTTQGPVRGYKEPNADVFVFYSIPYATTPVGQDRFKAPLPAPIWSELFEAVDKGIICPQSNDIIPEHLNKVIQEDCLIANVYVPNTEDRNLPVFVHVHGGAYMSGYGEIDKLTTFVETHNIIVVNFNYRLGVLGNLCLGTEGAPGNAGMKDHVALLRWVKKNIASFGGNPNDVTIGGCSAGGSSVHLLLFSKSAEGLFHKVAVNSGAAISPFAVERDPIATAKSQALGFNFENVDDIYELEKSFKNATVELLVTALSGDPRDSTVPIAPCVEREIPGVERFLDDAPINMLMKGDYRSMPMMFGFSDLEGLIQLSSFIFIINEMNNNMSTFLPADLQFENPSDREEVAKSAHQYYFMGHEDLFMPFIDYYSDSMFVYSMMRSIKLHQHRASTIYLFEYSFYDENSLSIPGMNISGAFHCAQMMPLAEGYGLPVTDEYREMEHIIRDMWASFIKTGNPVGVNSTLPAWPPVGAQWSPHMSIGREVKLGGSLLLDRMLFWENIYENYTRIPIPPPVPPPAEDSAFSHMAANTLIVSLVFIILFINKTDL